MVYKRSMNPSPERIPICFTDLARKRDIPAFAKAWNARQATYAELLQGQRPWVVIFQAESLQAWEERAQQTRRLAGELSEFWEPLQLVVHFDQAIKSDLGAAMEATFKLFPRLSARLNLSFGHHQLEWRVMEAALKCVAEEQERHKEAADALAQAQEVIAVGRRLRSARGRLSATAMASALGLKEAQMAAQLGRSRQALAKTPDALSIQQALMPFERIVRLRTVLKKPDFLAWLQTKNPHLDGRTPMAVMTSGRPEVVGDLVEAMLTGAPS